MQLKKALCTIVFLILTPIVFYYFYFWFVEIPTLGLSIDEVPWILDAQFYTHRQNRDWEKFALPNDYRILRWEESKRRLLDQPQFGKYFIGFLLDIKGQKPFPEKERNRLYGIVHTDDLPVGKTLNEAATTLGSEITNAILFIRFFSAGAGLGAILLLAWIAVKTTANRKMGLFAASYLLLSPPIRSAFRLATTDAFFVLFLLGSAVVLFIILSELPRLSAKRTLLSSFTLGILTACTASTKLPGTLLVFFPLFYFPVLLLFRPNKIRTNAYQKNILVFLGSSISAFLVTFLFLEPEFWGHPIRGATALFGSRIIQQERFYRIFGEFGWAEPLYILTVFLSITKQPVVSSILIALLVLGFHELWEKGKRNPKSRLLLLLVGYGIMTNASYARVKLAGFERYLIPSVFILTLVTSVGLKRTTDWLTKTLQSKGYGNRGLRVEG